MTAQSTKKLSLKKETLRPLDANQIEQLDGAVGGVAVTIVTVTIIFVPEPAY
ncbi:class I lanthipeptide [Pyxidicoccus sp. 3LG]